MADYKPTLADIEAATQVLDDINELSDSLTPDECVEYRVALEKLRQAAALTISLLDQQLVKVLEGDLVRDGKRYYIARKHERRRFDHGRIGGHVIRLAQEGDHLSGEIPDREEAVRKAVHILGNIYLSESTGAKVGQLDRYNIPRSEVLEITRGPLEVRVTSVGTT